MMLSNTGTEGTYQVSVYWMGVRIEEMFLSFSKVSEDFSKFILCFEVPKSKLYVFLEKTLIRNRGRLQVCWEGWRGDSKDAVLQLFSLTL